MALTRPFDRWQEHRLVHYITVHWSPHQGDLAMRQTCRNSTASCRQSTFTAQLPRLHPTQQQTHRLYNSNPNIAHRIEVIRYQRRPRQILQVNLLLLAGPEDGGSDAGEATIREPRLRTNSGSVRAGKSRREHQFDLGRNPVHDWELKPTFSYFDCLMNIAYAIDD